MERYVPPQTLFSILEEEDAIVGTYGGRLSFHFCLLIVVLGLCTSNFVQTTLDTYLKSWYICCLLPSDKP